MSRAVHSALATLAALTLGAAAPAVVVSHPAVGVELLAAEWPADDEVVLAKIVGAAVERPQPAQVEDEDPGPVYVGDDGEHVDSERLAEWLAEVDSPLAEYATELVDAGIAHDVDPRLVVAIAMIESTAGQHKPTGSHNAWGWGGSSGLVRWDSWPEAIDTFTARFAALYDTDQLDRRMAQTYCPPCWEHWLQTVTVVYQDI